MSIYCCRLKHILVSFSLPQTQQTYAHMDMDLKRTLVDKLNEVAPEYGLVELSYPSFMRCYGYRTQPLSAADAVEAINTLLDVAKGVRMEIEIEGTRNGGEWFGRGRVWEGDRPAVGKKRDEELSQDKETQGLDDSSDPSQEERWWIQNFWAAYDAVSRYVRFNPTYFDSELIFTRVNQLQEALKLSMSLHRSIIQQGTSIIDKQDIRRMRNHRVVVLSQGPNLELFSHPGVLSRLALWLVDALRDRIPGANVSARSKKESLPFVVACLNEKTQTYIVVGVMAALDFGEVRKKCDYNVPLSRDTDVWTIVSSVSPSWMRKSGVMRGRGTERLTRASLRLSKGISRSFWIRYAKDPVTSNHVVVEHVKDQHPPQTTCPRQNTFLLAYSTRPRPTPPPAHPTHS